MADLTAPPVIHFVPIEGERLEHLATERRGPLRWTASVVLTVQALVRRGPGRPDPVTAAVATDLRRTGRSRAEARVARRRRRRRALRVRQARPIRQTRTPEPMPGSGWSWNADDERSWASWEASTDAGDADNRLASLGTDLERPLPAPLRFAQRVGGRRRPRAVGHRRPNLDDA